MLVSESQLIDLPIMSLQTGKEIARTESAIINPHNLSIIAYQVSGKQLDYDPSYLRIADVREIGSVGMIVNDSDELVVDDDIVSEKPIYEMAYELKDKPVINEDKKKIGKVEDYIVEVDSFVIQQLVVRRPLLQSFHNDELVVHRGQIAEVTDDMVIIKSGKHKTGAKTRHNRQYANPFRQSSPQPEAIRSKD
mgnify:CR=1 FL=1|jgi:uncharacterized protein YrrD|tara:strand:- start:3291 stop:3869 length:579 start_codon:yes stop_codon:yes gene_type:complete